VVRTASSAAGTRVRTAARQGLLPLLIVVASGCTPAPAPIDPEPETSPANIAPQVLPGEWDVLGESVVFRFDERGIPTEIYNVADPLDWRTNVTFGGVQHLEAPVGSIDITYEPGEPYIDRQTGEARFEAYGTGRNLRVFLLPVPGEGYGTFRFTGTYDASAGTLEGTIEFAVFAGGITLYSDAQQRTLRKKDTPAEDPSQSADSPLVENGP